ncbi:MAG TPA: SRPBCC family protein [Thermoanaerobaculia bacterium]|nr:SRPBCC family protein [Thermoanaerobaculia bacterium]
MVSIVRSQRSRLRRNVAQPERVGSVIAGAAIAAYGVGRRTVGGIGLAMVGGVLIYRGATGWCPLYGALGLSTTGSDDSVTVAYGHGIRVDESVAVQRSPEELYQFWSGLENLPSFFSHVKSVDPISKNRSHWVSRGPVGSRVEWDAEIINDVENELIAWRSLPGSRVAHAGSVHFTPAGEGTEVRVILRYDPPAGKAGAAFARLFGEDPSSQIAEDLQQLKSILEQEG